MPQWVLEVVSQTPRGEYAEKFRKYGDMGVLYYTIYNPQFSRRDKHDPFEVYRLIDGVYVRQRGNPVWMPEIGLGIGTRQGTHEGIDQEWLYWFDEAGNVYPAPVDVLEQERRSREQTERSLEQERQQREAAEQQLEQERRSREAAEQQLEQERRSREALLNRLRQLGIDPEELS